MFVSSLAYFAIAIYCDLLRSFGTSTPLLPILLPYASFIMDLPIKIVLRLRRSPNEDLDVAEAFAKQPDVVREGLLEAISLVPLQPVDITLLRILEAFLNVY